MIPFVVPSGQADDFAGGVELIAAAAFDEIVTARPDCSGKRVSIILSAAGSPVLDRKAVKADIVFRGVVYFDEA